VGTHCDNFIINVGPIAPNFAGRKLSKIAVRGRVKITNLGIIPTILASFSRVFEN
jgi:hypothetical protein